jgi:hypothetical protein
MKFEKWYEENFGPVEPGVPFHLPVLKFAYESGAEIEREACAKVCEEISDSAHALWKVDADPTEQGRDIGAEHCAQAIRARGSEDGLR